MQRIKHPIYGYFRPQFDYFKAIIHWQESHHQVQGLEAEHIGYENGVLGGVVSALKVLCSPGDKVLVHAPTYVGFSMSLKNNGYDMISSPLVEDEQGICRMDYKDMDEKLKANWVPMTNEQEGEFLELQELAAAAIVTANRWSKSLAGFATAGQLGTNQQIRQEMEYLQNTVIKQRQNLMLSRIINPFLEVSAEAGLVTPGIQFAISNSLPVSFIGEISVENALTQDEKREVLGYGLIEVEEKPIPEPQNNAANGDDPNNGG